MRIRLLHVLAVIVAAVVAGGCKSQTSSCAPPPTTSAAFSQTDLVVGTGAIAGSGNRLTVSYVGWLHNSSRTDAKGSQFDAGPAFQFTLGAGAVIRGWDQGVVGMRVGGQRRLVIPPDLAYGSQSSGCVIPPNATLVFDITLISVQ